MGRFLTRDTWSGDVNSPISLNQWTYAQDNPILYTDPSGYCINPDGSIIWWKWPWFKWGKCPSSSLVILNTPTPSFTSLPTSIPSATSTSVPGYISSNAVAYALSHYNNPNPLYNYYDPVTGNSDCTNFVSQALLNGGLPIDPGLWEPYTPAWIQTPSLYEYLTKKYYSVTYSNDSLYAPYSFQQLRGYGKWESFLQTNKSNIKAGDLVFYWDNEIWQNWSHVAIITNDNWQPETINVLKNNPTLIQYSSPGALKPEIVEHNGPTFGGSSAPDIRRSIDDTANLYIKYVSIVFMSRPK